MYTATFPLLYCIRLLYKSRTWNQRSQRVRIGTDYSGWLHHWLHLNGAMPQGSWLGPLSLVLIDDLDVDCLIHKYVNDTTLCVQHQPSNMELFFHQLQVWANNNDMVVNLNKTKEIVMGPPSKTSHLPLLHLSPGDIECVKSVKLLGINLDADFFVEVTCQAHHVQGNSETLFSKTTQACGCVPGLVALFLYRGNQTCTGICGPGLESLAHENTN